ncbi:LPS export ABC transporter periplasmic protein LptC [Gammaproteobacteria bacterium]|jgi:lipopolysaccharide export system protein LptC|nr:LPS export ABC transporter periplasmic protein LptC [Gammaproteobacteria bacterium]
MKIVEKILFVLLFGVLGLLSIWLQFGIIEQEQVVFDGNERHDPDYYIENFTATGMDKLGRRRYVLEAERLVHYPDDDTALLDNPHIIQYEDGAPPRHTYSESGWISSDGNEVLLTGNVRVLQNPGGENGAGGGEITTEKMRIYLDNTRNKPG